MSAAPDQLQPTNQAPTVATPKRWPLVNSLGYRATNLKQDAQIINGYCEKDKLLNVYQVEKRPGFALTPVVTGTGPGQGIITVPYINTGGSAPNLGYVYQTLFVMNNQAYFIYTNANGVASAPVAIAGTVFPGLSNTSPPAVESKFQFLSIPQPGSAPFILFSPNNASAYTSAPSNWWYDGTGSGGLHVLQPGVNGYPNNLVPGFVYVNGYIYGMDWTGAIWQTATQNQCANWSGNQITASSDADIGVQLARQLIYTLAIKSWTTQIFYDAGNPVGSSLSPLSGAQWEFGCLSADTYQNLDGTLFWVTQSKKGTYTVVQVDNLEFKTISYPEIERQLDLGPGSVWYSQAYQHAGHKFYVLTNVTNNVTMVYDVKEQIWTRWTDYQGNYFPVIDRAPSPGGAEWHQFGNGNIYQLGPDYLYPNDYGNIVPVDIYTPNFDDGVGRIKYLSQMRFNADQTPGSVLQVRSSDDDYQTWSQFRNVDLSQKPENCILNDEGSFYRRAYHFRQQCNTGFRIRSVDLQMDRGVM